MGGLHACQLTSGAVDCTLCVRMCEPSVSGMFCAVPDPV